MSGGLAKAGSHESFTRRPDREAVNDNPADFPGADAAGEPSPNDTEGATMPDEVLERIHKLEVAQATQAAAATGVEATQAAVQAGAAATGAASIAGLASAVASGAAGFIIGVFMGMAIVKARA